MSSAVVQTDKKKMAMKWINIVIVLLLMFGFGQIVQPFSTVTPVGVKVIGVFLGVIYGWGTCGMLWPSLLGMVALGLTGLFSVTDAIALGMGNQMVLFMILMLIVVENMNHTGIIINIANWMISRPICKGRPWVFATMIFFTAFIVSGFANAFPALFLCWGFWYSIFKQTGYKPYDKFVTCALCGVVFACILGSILLPFHNQPLIFLTSFAAMTGIETISFVGYLGVLIPYTLACLLEYVLLCKFIIRPDVEKLKNFDPLLLTEGKPIIFTKRQIASAMALIAVMLGLLLPGILPKTWAITQFLSSVGMAGWGIIVITIMCWIKIDGEPLLEFNKVAKQGVAWDVILFVVMILVISSVITNEATGISPFLGQALGPIFAGKSMFVFTALIVVCSVVMTNFMNNMVTGFLFMNIVAAYMPVLLANNLSPWTVVTLVIISANLAFWTPVASSTAGLLYSNSEWVKKMDVFKVAFITSIFWIITMLTLAFGLANLLLH